MLKKFNLLQQNISSRYLYKYINIDSNVAIEGAREKQLPSKILVQFYAIDIGEEKLV